MSQFNTLLGMDSTLSGCCVAAFSPAGFCSKREQMSGGQSERLMPLIGEVLAECRAAYQNIDAILVTTGPGAFTGLRIGLSTARTLAMSIGCPLFGITTFQALALTFSETHREKPFSVIIETKRSDYYFQKFDCRAHPLSSPAAINFDEMDKCLDPDEILIGDGVGRYLQNQNLSQRYKAQEGYTLPDMAAILRHFLDLGARDRFFNNAPEPLYLRSADVSPPKHSRRVLS